MNFGLLVVDLSARLLGLLGLATLVVFGCALAGVYGSGPGVQILDTTCVLFVLIRTAEFLLPNRFENRMLDTENLLDRVSYHISNIIFILLCGFLLLRNGVANQDSITDLSKSWGLIATAVAMGVFVVIFASGVAFRAYGQYREDIVSGVVAAPGDTAEPRIIDLLDRLCQLAIFAPCIAILVGLFLNDTVSSPEYYQWENANSQMIVALFAALPLVGGLLMALRGPVLQSNGKISSRPVLVLAAVFFAGVAYVGWSFLCAHTLVPSIANRIIESPEASRNYTILDSSTERYLGLCLTLEPEDTPNAKVKSCGFEKDLMKTLSPGTRVSFTGELSEYGHTLESYQILR